MDKSRPVVEVVKAIVARHEATPAQVSLSWLINYSGDAVVAIPGASKPRHAQEAARAMALTLSAEEIDGLERVSRPFK